MNHLIRSCFTVAVVGLFATSCQEDNETTSQLSDSDILIAENEATMESAFEDVDDIGYEGLLLFESGGRMEERKESPIRCATKTHDKELNIITIDFGDGCEDRFGKVRSGKIIITYTDRRFVPGAVHAITFENFFIDGIQIEGTRTRTNISESTEDTLKFQTVLEAGKVTWEDGTFATREADWITTRIRASNPINDERILTGGASGVTREGANYTVEITKDIVWKRGCLSNLRVMVPVEGTKVKEVEGGSTVVIDYGDGTCDNLIDITKDGVTETVEYKGHKRKLH